MDRRLPYVPALDGVRGIALAVLLLFHAGMSFVPGGHLGVTSFFTLSGFLITSLLLLEHHRSGTVDLRAFWGRRARRLVPALLLCLPLVAVVVELSEEAPPSGLMGDAVAALFWVANWRFIVDEQTYGDLFTMPSPFQHFWTLAIEEQFYLFLPLLLLLVFRARRRMLVLVSVLVGLTALSTLQAARLAAAGGEFGRAYFGTDARIAEILVGALLAVCLVTPSGLRSFTGSARRLVTVAGLCGAAALVIAILTVEKGDAVLYRGGFLMIAVATAAVIALAVQPGSLLNRVLAWQPFVWLGMVSYGAYLFHWPVFLSLTERSTGSDPFTLLVVRLGVTFALAWFSYTIVELPIRRRGMSLPAGITSWATGATIGLVSVALAAGLITIPEPQAPGAPLAAGTAAAAPPPGTAKAAPAVPKGRQQQAVRQRSRPGTVRQQSVTPGRVQAVPVVPQPARRMRSKVIPKQFTQDPGQYQVPPVPTAPPGALKVVMVGDSIGVNLGDGLLDWAATRDDVVVYNLAVPACPISRGGERRVSLDRPLPVHEACGWWADSGHERRKALEQFDPDVIVLEDGVNEIFDRRLPAWGEWRHAGQPQFDQWLIGEYQKAVDQWRQGGARTLMINTPCADWERYEKFDEVGDTGQRTTALNLNVHNRVLNVSRADLFQRVCPNGRYRDQVEGVADGRPDGFHFSRAAAAALAENWLGPLVIQASRSTLAPPTMSGAG